jgi:DNA-binding IclR family transcriptional regulator
MTTTAKVLQVLQLFKQGHERLRAAEVMQRLGVSSATVYRYLADLEAAGLIERASINEYVLGPTVIELDRLIRENDPLIASAREIMKTLSERTGGTVLLSRLHDHKVVCVHQVHGRNGPRAVSYERGRAMPLFRGATSKIILAHLPAELLREIAAQHAGELRRASMPASFDALSQALAGLRTNKVCAAAGEVDPGAMGWAAALHQGRHLLGSLSVVLSRNTPPADPARLTDQLLRAALRIEGRMQPSGH